MNLWNMDPMANQFCKAQLFVVVKNTNLSPKRVWYCGDMVCCDVNMIKHVFFLKKNWWLAKTKFRPPRSARFWTLENIYFLLCNFPSDFCIWNFLVSECHPGRHARAGGSGGDDFGSHSRYYVARRTYGALYDGLLQADKRHMHAVRSGGHAAVSCKHYRSLAGMASPCTIKISAS